MAGVRFVSVQVRNAFGRTSDLLRQEGVLRCISCYDNSSKKTGIWFLFVFDRQQISKADDDDRSIVPKDALNRGDSLPSFPGLFSCSDR